MQCTTMENWLGTLCESVPLIMVMNTRMHASLYSCALKWLHERKTLITYRIYPWSSSTRNENKTFFSDNDGLVGFDKTKIPMP